MALTSTGKIYTGIALDPKKRIAVHNSGKGAKCLRGQRPVALAWVFGPMTKSLALHNEYVLKGLSHETKMMFI